MTWSIALDAFGVLRSQYPAALATVPENVPIAPAVFMEDDVHRTFDPQTQRTTRTGTVVLLASVSFTENPGGPWLINGLQWVQHHLSAIDNGLRAFHVRRDEKVMTGTESRNGF